MTLAIRVGAQIAINTLIIGYTFLNKPEKNRVNSTEEKVKQKFKSFLEEQKIRSDIIYSEQSNSGVFSAIGVNLPSRGSPVILMHPGAYEKDEKASDFVMKHEFSHIKYNDTLTKLSIEAVAAAAATVFCFFIAAPMLSTFAITFGFTVTISIIVSQWRERAADNFAIKHSTDEELKGGRRFFQAMKEARKSKRSTFIKKLAYTESGEARFGFTHPSLKSRIQKIEKEMAKRNIKVDEKTENELIEKLTPCLATAV